MPRATKTVRVEEIPGEPMCYRVESWSRPQQPHRVELLANAGFGQCSCTHWATKKWPTIRDKACTYIGTKLTDCRHVEAARVKFNTSFFPRMAADHCHPASP